MELNGPALKALRERSGWTQSDLARHTGVSQGRISELESQDRTSVRPGTIKSLANALQVPSLAIIATEATAS